MSCTVSKHHNHRSKKNEYKNVRKIYNAHFSEEVKKLDNIKKIQSIRERDAILLESRGLYQFISCGFD